MDELTKEQNILTLCVAFFKTEVIKCFPGSKKAYRNKIRNFITLFPQADHSFSIKSSSGIDRMFSLKGTLCNNLDTVSSNTKDAHPGSQKSYNLLVSTR